MTPRERAEKLFREHINHHTLYATDAQTITDALAEAFAEIEGEKFDLHERLVREKAYGAETNRAYNVLWEQLQTVTRQLQYAISSGNSWREMAMSFVKTKLDGTATPTPTPGSPEALARGCLCAAVPAYAVDLLVTALNRVREIHMAWVADACPLHGTGAQPDAGKGRE